jgi:hypothetical protein
VASTIVSFISRQIDVVAVAGQWAEPGRHRREWSNVCRSPALSARSFHGGRRGDARRTARELVARWSQFNGKAEYLVLLLFGR